MDHGKTDVADDFPLEASETILAKALAAEPVRIGIYFLIREGRIVYVGQSRHIASRVASHAQKKVFDRWHWVPCGTDQLNALERFYIQSMLPEDNRAGIPKLRRVVPIAAKIKPSKAALPVVQPKPTIKRAPIPRHPNARTREEIELIDEDRPARQAEWMRRLRAVKADRNLRIDDDFGPNPFSLEWRPTQTPTTP